MTRTTTPPHPDATAIAHILSADCRRVLREAYQSIQMASRRRDAIWLTEAITEYRAIVRLWLDDSSDLHALGV